MGGGLVLAGGGPDRAGTLDRTVVLLAEAARQVVSTAWLICARGTEFAGL